MSKNEEMSRSKTRMNCWYKSHFRFEVFANVEAPPSASVVFVQRKLWVCIKKELQQNLSFNITYSLVVFAFQSNATNHQTLYERISTKK